jgi:hypothetical protein
VILVYTDAGSESVTHASKTVQIARPRAAMFPMTAQSICTKRFSSSAASDSDRPAIA